MNYDCAQTLGDKSVLLLSNTLKNLYRDELPVVVWVGSMDDQLFRVVLTKMDTVNGLRVAVETKDGQDAMGQDRWTPTETQQLDVVMLSRVIASLVSVQWNQTAPRCAVADPALDES